METKLMFTFTFKIQDRSYSFNEIAETKEAALEMLKQDLTEIVNEINPIETVY